MFQPSVFAFRLRLFALATCVAAVLICATVLLGWMLDIAQLKSVVPGQVSMNPTTAVVLTLGAISLWLVASGGTCTRRQKIARALGVPIAVVGVLKVADYLTGGQVPIDRLLFSERLIDNCIAPNTAMYLILLGLSLALLDVKTRRGLWPAQWLALLVAAGSFLALVGYLYGAEGLYGVDSYIPMAINTAIVFHLLSLGVVCSRPDRGLIKELSSERAGGVLARRLLPAVILIPLGLGWLRLVGENAGFYDMPFGAALMVAFNAAMFVGLIWWAAVTANRSDVERDQFFNLSLDSLCVADGNGYFRRVNQAFTTVLGYSAEELTSRPFPEFIHPDDRSASLVELGNIVAGTDCLHFENRFQHKDGSYRWLAWTCRAPLLGDDRLFAVARDVTERKAAEHAILRLNADLEDRVRARTAELTKTNEELGQKNQENEMFVYSVSHDLRSPLVNLQGFSQELATVCGEIRDIFSKEELPSNVRERGLALVDNEMKESIRFIQTSVMRLSRIIDALLRLSRVGRIEYQWQPVDVQGLVATVITSAAGTIDEKGAEVTVGPLPTAWGDPTAIEQVFANLIGNALNYLDPARVGKIEIGCSGDDTRASDAAPAFHTYYVRDNGLGIPEAYRTKIFQAFQRLHTDAAKGEGIGLTLVRRMVERHGGKIWFESVAGEGSTFFVTLPTRATGQPEPAFTEISKKQRAYQDASAAADCVARGR